MREKIAGKKEEKAMSLRVGTFNIASTKQLDIVAQRELTMPYELDMVGLQEVDRFTDRHTYDMLASFAQDCYQDFYFSKAMDMFNGDYGIGCVSQFALSDTSDTFLNTIGANEKRVFQRCVFHKDGKEIAFYNTHISYETPDIRERQFDQIMEAMKLDPVPYKVLVGDFNADQSHHEFDPFLAEFDMVNGHEGIWYDTFNEVDETMKVNSVDNIIISRNLRIEEVIMVETKRSDHNLLMAQLGFLDTEII